MKTMRCLVGFVACSLLLASAGAQTATVVQYRSINSIQNVGNQINLPDGVLPLEFAVRKYRITYTMDYLGQPHEVSGALFVPMDETGNPASCALPTHTYMHGTTFERDEAPSYSGFEGQIGFLMATGGMLCLMPDYLGLGSSDDVLHPYIHAESEAESGIALLQAVETLADELGISMNGQHFVSGYSQGGHASMALARRMQEDPDAGFPLAGAAPMSGPYDMSGTQVPIGMTLESYANPAYLPYLILSWQQTYGNLFVDLGEVFQEPYVSALPGYFDGETSGWYIDNFLDGPTSDLVQPEALESMMMPGHPFHDAALDNDVYDWVPESPMRLFYCTEDEQVFYENALLAEAWMNENGASNVTSIDGGPLDHSDCALLAILGGSLWINDMADLCSASSVTEKTSSGLSWRPFAEGVHVMGMETGQPWTLLGVDGRTLQTGTASGKGDLLFPPHGLSILRTLDGRVARLARD